MRDADFVVVGSGVDVVGRGIGARVDAGEFGRVVRVNKPYGAPADIGTRTDLLVTRWTPWVTRFFGECWQPEAPVVVLNECKGIAADELMAARVEVGWQNVSAGVLACMWLLNRGARRVRVVGFGWRPDAGWDVGKHYPGGERDENPNYYWDLERHWLAHNVELI